MRQLWRYRCEECFQDSKRTIFGKIGSTVKSISSSIQVHEAAARASGDHDVTAMFVYFQHSLQDPSYQ